MNYEKLLKKAKEELPETTKSQERFEVPNVRGHIQGNKTIISNFNLIASTLRREPKHILKFILKELATPGDIKKKGLILGRKVSARMINKKIAKYVKEYVTCKECGKPDTKLVTEDRIDFIKCTACGAIHPIKTRI
ncbi:MAG: Translation initiation factor 2 subunit beta [Candidatus Woesearchaeota archaeon]|nr:Translation initiation factor 2 subunit beta [Candidatus Woesearchaeota archaeon]